MTQNATVELELLCDRVVGFGHVQYAGDRIEVSPDEAAALVRAGQAQPVRTRAVETTARQPNQRKRRQAVERPVTNSKG